MADPIGSEFLRSSGLPEDQIAMVKGLGGDGETLSFDAQVKRIGSLEHSDTTVYFQVGVAGTK